MEMRLCHLYEVLSEIVISRRMILLIDPNYASLILSNLTNDQWLLLYLLHLRTSSTELSSELLLSEEMFEFTDLINQLQ